MQILNAALAFALTMLVFSTAVAGIVEAIHQIGRLRQQGMQEMLEAFYERVIRPKLGTDQGTGKCFAEHLAANRAVMGKANGKTRQVTAMTALEFVERLAETRAGEELVKAANAKGAGVLDGWIEDLARKFTRYAEDATAHFRERAWMLSVVVAVVFAFASNIDAVRLFKTFASDDALSATIVARKDAILAAAKEYSTADPGEDGKKAAGQLVEGVQEAVRTAGAAAELGLPIGTAYYPWCLGDGKQDGLCASIPGKPGEVWANLWNGGLVAAVSWFLGVLFTGLLIGLGSPFWYARIADLTRITRVAETVRDVLGKGRPQGGTEVGGAVGAAGGPAAPGAEVPASMAEAFRKGARAAGVELAD